MTLRSVFSRIRRSKQYRKDHEQEILGEDELETLQIDSEYDS
jgi:hypothetical protein